MRTENEKAPQTRAQLLPSPCHVSFINHEHAYNYVLMCQSEFTLGVWSMVNNEFPGCAFKATYKQQVVECHGQKNKKHSLPFFYMDVQFKIFTIASTK